MSDMTYAEVAEEYQATCDILEKDLNDEMILLCVDYPGEGLRVTRDYMLKRRDELACELAALSSKEKACLTRSIG